MSFCRQKYTLETALRAQVLTTVPDSTSQKFMLLGQVPRSSSGASQGRYAIVHLDFAGTRTRKCDEGDFERWYARAGNTECLMGHKVRPLSGYSSARTKIVLTLLVG
jgi:hypothetical protein